MRFAFFCLLVCLPSLASAQKRKDPGDTTAINLMDSSMVNPNAKVITIETYAKRFDPRKAMLFSAVLPGAGQVYNKKYWKVPLVYGLIAGGIFYLDYNNDLYKSYKAELFSILNEPNPPIVNKEGVTPSGNLVANGVLTSPSKLSVDQLRNAVNRYRRDRDFSVLMVGIVFFAQMIDAHIDAHLKEFELNPQLKVAIEPTIQQPVGLYGRSSGLSLTLRF